MYDQKYVLLVTELRSLMHAYELLKDVVDTAEADLRWRLAELFQEVKLLKLEESVQVTHL